MADEASRYEIRAALASDHLSLLELARFLDSVNLPHDPAAIRELVEASENSFSGHIGDARLRRYVFVLWDRQDELAVGTSMIIGQKGRKDAAYVYLDVLPEEKYSPTLDKHFKHKVLRIGYSYNGPTEIGGLVVHGDYRRSPAKLGMLISYVRFLFIRAHRDEMQNYVLAELMPPLAEDGTSHLWQAVGRRFTGLTYREADRLSKSNKAFIRSLFPDGDIYATLLSDEARAAIGEVGRETRGVEKLLRRIGFRYVDRVDPFDGGPHFAAETEEIELVKRTGSATISVGNVEDGARALVAREWDGPPFFRALPLQVQLDGDAVVVTQSGADDLEVAEGDRVWVLPLRRPA